VSCAVESSTYAHSSTIEDADTQASAFHCDTGTLLVEAPIPLVASQLNGYFTTVVRGVLARIGAGLQGVAITEVDCVPKPLQLSEAAQQELR